MGYPAHPLADLFPMLDGADLDALAADIKSHGLADPITMLGELVLDGRNRQAACERAGVTPRYVDYDGTDPAGFVVSRNLHRRHLTTGQRAMVAAKLANLTHGGHRWHSQEATSQEPNSALDQPTLVDSNADDLSPVQTPTVTIQEAATMLNVSKTAVKDGKTVMEDGTPELIELAEMGDVSVSAAATVAAELTPEEQQEVVAAGPAAVKAKAAEIRTEQRKKPGKTPAAVASNDEAAAILRDVEALADRLTRWMRSDDPAAAAFVHHAGHLQAARCVLPPFTLMARDPRLGRPIMVGLAGMKDLIQLAAGRVKPLSWPKLDKWWQAKVAGAATDSPPDEHDDETEPV